VCGGHVVSERGGGAHHGCLPKAHLVEVRVRLRVGVRARVGLGLGWGF
jgi:hypothetical protein